jgi:hypothetical protein
VLAVPVREEQFGALPAETQRWSAAAAHAEPAPAAKQRRRAPSPSSSSGDDFPTAASSMIPVVRRPGQDLVSQAKYATAGGAQAPFSSAATLFARQGDELPAYSLTEENTIIGASEVQNARATPARGAQRDTRGARVNPLAKRRPRRRLTARGNNRRGCTAASRPRVPRRTGQPTHPLGKCRSVTETQTNSRRSVCLHLL